MGSWWNSAPLPPPPPPPPFSMQQAQLQQYMQMLGGIRVSTPEPPPARPKSLIAGPILAWRLWKVRLDGFLLSVFKGTIWPSGTPLRAKNPAQIADVGVYALKQRQALNGTGYDMGADQLWMVPGQVALWGTVIEHEKGYRAEYAYPVLLDFTPPMPGFPRPAMLTEVMAMLRHRYGCEVRG